MFYDQLKKACQERGISVTKLCENLGISSANTGRWKKGGTPSVDVLQKMAVLLNVSVDSLLSQEENNPPVNEPEGGSELFYKGLRYISYNIAETQQLVEIFESLDVQGRAMVLAKAIEEQRIQAANAAKQISSGA